MFFALKYFHKFRFIVWLHLSTILDFSSFSVDYKSTLCLYSSFILYLCLSTILRWGLRWPHVLECFCNFETGYCLQRDGPAIFTEHGDNHEDEFVTFILFSKRLHFHKNFLLIGLCSSSANPLLHSIPVFSFCQ